MACKIVAQNVYLYCHFQLSIVVAVTWQHFQRIRGFLNDMRYKFTFYLLTYFHRDRHGILYERRVADRHRAPADSRVLCIWLGDDYYARVLLVRDMSTESLTAF